MASDEAPGRRADARAGRREDLLVSICFPEMPADAAAFDLLAGFAAEIDVAFRFWEILVVVTASEAERYEPVLRGVPNLRLLKLRYNVPSYRRRVIAAEEAIGDVVALAALDELPWLDVGAMLATAHGQGGLVLGHREQVSPAGPVLSMLGRLSGFRIDAADMRTVAYPRTLLNLLLARPDRQLTLRFPPRDPGISVIRVASGATLRRRTLSEAAQRLGLIQKLLVNAAPLVLSSVSLLSAITVVAALCFAVYAVVVSLTLEDVAEGWLTISLALSLTSAFIGMAFFGLSTGMQKALDVLSPDAADDVVDEQSSVDLFGQVLHDLNVEVDGARPQALVPHATGRLDGERVGLAEAPSRGAHDR